MTDHGSWRPAVTGSLILLLSLLATIGFAHLCNNIYKTPDRIIVKPEKPVATVVGTEEFRVFVQNNYPTYLDNLRLAAKLDTDQVDVNVTPESIKRLKAGERTSFTIKLTEKPGAESVKHALAFSISADNIGWRPVEEVTTDALKTVLDRESNLSATVQAAESLVARGDPKGSEYLTRIATTGGRDYQSRAIRALGKGKQKTNIEFLRTMLDNQDGFLRGNALLALGLLKDKSDTFTPLLEDRDEFVKTSAAAGLVLAGSKDKKQLSYLKECLKSENAYVRIASGWALASRKDKDAIAVLDQAFATNDAMQRVMSGDAMVDIANRR